MKIVKQHRTLHDIVCHVTQHFFLHYMSTGPSMLLLFLLRSSMHPMLEATSAQVRKVTMGKRKRPLDPSNPHAKHVGKGSDSIYYILEVDSRLRHASAKGFWILRFSRSWS